MNLQNKRILVTGANGFVGSFIVEAALAAGAEVWAAVRASSDRSYLTDKRIHFFPINLADKAQLTESLTASGGFDGVIHCAGVTKVVHTEDFHRVNCEGTRTLSEALMQTGTLRGRFVFISSLSVMGESKSVPTPNSAYGKSKLAAEQALAALEGLDYVVLRPTGVYGPREKDYFLMAKSIRQGIDFAVGFKPQVITFIYVKDLAQAALMALTQGQRGKAYFLTDGGEYSSRTFSDLLQQELGRKHVLHITAPLWLLRAVCNVNGRWAAWRGHSTTLNMDKYYTLAQRDWRCDTSATQGELGFRPAYSLAQGVKETVAWYKQQGWL
ncbi:MAG: NAD(P)-dependent oxidoreductase [Bacteroidaceae bacterium]|nr:NAD(P)-dependent oxidoreductase [Bacteroidaceae bacterium]